MLYHTVVFCHPQLIVFHSRPLHIIENSEAKKTAKFFPVPVDFSLWALPTLIPVSVFTVLRMNGTDNIVYSIFFLLDLCYSDALNPYNIMK